MTTGQVRCRVEGMNQEIIKETGVEIEREAGTFYYTGDQASEKSISLSLSPQAVIMMMFEQYPEDFERETQVKRFYIN